jgi:hypothetical protein
MVLPKKNIKTRNNFSKERIPCCTVHDKYVDRLLEKDSSSLSLDLALLLTIIRFERIPSIKELSKLFQKDEIEIENSLTTLSQIGFLSIL